MLIFVGHLTTLSVSRLCSVDGRMTNELEMIWKEAIVSQPRC
jgi:hypothetical protein